MSTPSPQRLDELPPQPAAAGGAVYGITVLTGDDARFLLGVPHGLATLDGDGKLASSQRPVADVTGGFVPTRIPDGHTYIIPEGAQALYALPILVEGTLIINGHLVEVA